MNAPNVRQAPAPFKLNITRGVKWEPPRIVIHGAPGIGKSTLASNAPAPLFIDLEHGTKQIDVARVDDIDTWEALLAALYALAADPGDFRTVVIDTLDRAEWLCWQHLCAKERVDSVEKIGRGYGKGFTAAYEQFRAFAAALEALRRKGLAIIIIAHSKIEKAPEDDRERWTLKVHKQVAGLFYEMFDAILYARLEVFTQKAESGKLRGIGDARVLETQEDPKWLAKNRYAMPRQIPLSWDDLNDAMNRGASQVASALRAELDAALDKLAELDTAAGEHARREAEGVTDVTRMNALLGRVNAGIAKRINTKND